jgi:membrane protease YdiL (CAAX protease family)
VTAAVRRAAWPLAVLAGCLLLAARPALAHASPRPDAVLAAVLVLVGAAGLARRDATSAPSRAAFPLAVGLAAMLLARLVAGHAALPFTPYVVATNTLAAVAEEAFFRRLAYGVLLRWGAPVAVVGSAVAFAAVHVTTYGVAVLPLDLAAGLLLSWQRHASGTWRVPALTHVLANLLAVI